MKEKHSELKKTAEDSDIAIADLKKKLRAAEGEAKRAGDAVKNNKDTKKLELTKKVRRFFYGRNRGQQDNY